MHKMRILFFWVLKAYVLYFRDDENNEVLAQMVYPQITLISREVISLVEPRDTSICPTWRSIYISR